MTIFSFFGDANKRYVEQLNPQIERISVFEKRKELLSGEELFLSTKHFRERLEAGESPDDLLPEVFAAVREAAKRTLNQRHFDAQLAAGIVLHQGKIAEMKTGEGKTLASTLAVYLNGLAGKGAHIVTVNDYLTRRDAVWMGQIYYSLGATVGCLTHDQAYLYDSAYRIEKSDAQIDPEILEKQDEERDLLGSFKVAQDFLKPCSRKEAYAADITYGTNNEFGFDYLRDNMVYDSEQKVQRGNFYAIVDEVDSILIDEARTPLIIVEPDVESSDFYKKFSAIVPRLEKDKDFEVDEKLRSATLTDAGIDKVENILGIDNLYGQENFKYIHYLEESLKAAALFHKDKDYIVKNGEILIVDEFTGRLLHGRRFSGGLHQAIEAKENVEVKQESRVLATITFQNYFRLYEKLAGMTGTAQDSAEEFHKVYGLDVISVPTNKPMIRKDESDLVFSTEKGKFQSIIREIKERNEKGQPILVGTRSIEKNEYLAAMLKTEGIKCELLNAKNHEREGAIIAQAGKFGSVTVATNMAGRGVDIILGGNPSSPEEAEKVKEAGGLFVLGTERHEARRIDNQLRGRSGRQGDAGESRFFISMEDDLMRIFAPEKIKNLMTTFKIPEDQPIESKIVSHAIESAQNKIEGFNFDIRKNTLEYDDVLAKQRNSVYSTREKILLSFKEGVIGEMIAAVLSEHLDYIFDSGIDAKFLSEMLFNVGVVADKPSFAEASEGKADFEKKLESLFEEKDKAKEFLGLTIKEACDKKKAVLGEENFKNIGKILMLQSLDYLWREHLENMEYLRESVRIRAYGQHDPLVEYKTESHRLFKVLFINWREVIFNNIFKVEISKNPRQSRPAPAKAVFGGKKIGRNDTCPCGAMKADGRPVKYKHCHGKNV